jgi:hypothetical protein
MRQEDNGEGVIPPFFEEVPPRFACVGQEGFDDICWWGWYDLLVRWDWKSSGLEGVQKSVFDRNGAEVDIFAKPFHNFSIPRRVNEYIRTTIVLWVREARFGSVANNVKE